MNCSPLSLLLWRSLYVLHLTFITLCGFLSYLPHLFVEVDSSVICLIYLFRWIPQLFASYISLGCSSVICLIYFFMWISQLFSHLFL